MTPWRHILIAALIPTLILLGGSILFFLMGRPTLAVVIPIPAAVICLLGFMKLVPASCPDCGGKAYLRRSKEKKFYYECAKCGILEKVDCSLDE